MDNSLVFNIWEFFSLWQQGGNVHHFRLMNYLLSSVTNKAPFPHTVSFGILLYKGWEWAMSTVTGRSAFANYLYNCTHSAKLKLSCVFYWIDELFEAVCSKLAIADLDFYKGKSRRIHFNETDRCWSSSQHPFPLPPYTI